MDLYVDRWAKVLVASTTSNTRVTFADVYYGDVIPFNVYVLDPNAGAFGLVPVKNPYTVASVAGFSLRVAIGARITGTASPLTEQNTWTKSPDNSYLTGNLSIATAELLAAFSGATPYSSWLEIKTDTGGNLETIYQQQITVHPRAISPTSVTPSTPQTPISKEEVMGTYLPIEQLTHLQRIEMSPNGTRFLVWRDDNGIEQSTQLS